MMHGELLQWGFWEDTHTYLCKCVSCDRPIAVEQVMPLDWSVQSGEEQQTDCGYHAGDYP
jgi:hypothetical protein